MGKWKLGRRTSVDGEANTTFSVSSFPCFRFFLQAVFERLAVVHDGHVVLTVGFLRGFGATDDLCRNTKRFALGDDAGCGFGLAVDFHAVPHVVDAEHFFGARAAGLLDRFEDRWDR